MNLNLDFLYYIFIGIVWFFAAVVFELICMSIMRNKGYTSLGQWFFYGFFFLLVGLIICLVMENKTDQMPPYGQPPMGQPGQPMPPYGQPPMGQPMMNQPPMAICCNACGMINVPGTVYCQQCGNKLQ